MKRFNQYTNLYFRELWFTLVCGVIDNTLHKKLRKIVNNKDLQLDLFLSLVLQETGDKNG